MSAQSLTAPIGPRDRVWHRIGFESGYRAALVARDNAPEAGKLSVPTDWPYIWFWRVKLGDRKGQRCRVWARGTMNSIGVEFEDGLRVVTARYAIRRSTNV